MRHAVPILVLMTWGAMGGTAYGGDWATAAEYGQVRLRVGNGDPARKAAEVFQRYWKECTGREAAESGTGEAGVEVVIGTGIDVSDLGPDGIAIRTSNAGGVRRLYLSGEGERGPLYAVYEFFDRYMGVRWLAPDCIHVPPAPESLPAIDYTHTPSFEHRDSSYYAPCPPEFAEAHRISRNPSFGLFVHTAYTIVPPDKYQDHPEYFALVRGTRRVPAGRTIEWPHGIAENIDYIGQLCWSNPDLPEVIHRELSERIARAPQHRIWSVSQMDWAGNCECDECRAIDDREGTPAGSLLTGLNAVADRLAESHPGYFLETLAYTYTRKAPRHIRPRDNIIIRLCSIECDFARPLEDPEAVRNVLFAQDIRDWSAIAKTLYIWDYTPNFRYFQAPHPNFHVLQPNLDFFAQHRVKGMFEQGCHAVGGEFAHLRRYIIAKCMWDVSLDGKALRDEFIDLYYREAAAPIREYIDILTERALDSGLSMTCFDELHWLNADTVERGRDCFRRAFAAAQADDVRARLVEASLPLELAALLCPPRAEMTPDTFIARRPHSMELEQYIQLCRSVGIVEPGEAQDFDRFRANLGGITPPRVLTSRLEKLENDRYELWVVPEMKGAVVRFRDKEHDIELLRAYRHYGEGPGTWEDWTETPGVLEHAVATSYDVVDRGPHSLTIEATTAEGIRVRRRLTLAPGSDRVEVDLSLKNTGTVPRLPRVKIHPEFAAQEDGVPQIWTGGPGGWTWVSERHDPRLAAYGDYLDRGDLTHLAYHMPGRDLSLVCDFDPEEVGSLLFFFNLDAAARQVNLEVLPQREPLAPGEERTIRARYRVVEGIPSGL